MSGENWNQEIWLDGAENAIILLDMQRQGA